MQALQGGMAVMVDGEGGAVAVPWWLTGDIAADGCAGAYCAINVASQADSYANLAVPSIPLTVGIAPGWSAGNGWMITPGQYLKTGIVPQPTWTMLIRFSNVTDTGIVAGVNTDGTRFWIRPYGSATTADFAFGPTVANFAGPIYSGVLGGKYAGGKIYAYKDGNKFAEMVASSGPTNLNEIYIGGRNVGSLSLPITAYVQAMALYLPDAISDAQIASVSAAMAAL